MLIFFQLSSNAADQKPVVRYDSSDLKISSPTKAQEEKLFADKELQYKQDEARDEGWFSRFINWLSDKLFGGTDPDKRDKVTQGMTWVLVIAALGVVVWLMTRTDFISFVRGESKQVEFNFSDLEEDLNKIDFEARISKALSENDFRLAIRWHYLKILELMNTKNLISWEAHKTNIDYIREMDRSLFSNAFRRISRIYEYAWYGRYEINAAQFGNMETPFRDLEKEVKGV